jgi:hypothetical protein
LLLMSGADQLIRWVSKLTRIPRAFLYGAFVAVQVGIFLWAFFSMRYFYFRL